MKIGYVRVSTVEQNETRQMEALEKMGVEKFFTEKVSGKSMNRPELQKMIEFAREGDTIHIHDFSRISRSVSDLLVIMQQLKEKGIELVSNKESIDTSTPTGKLMVTMIAAINEFERTNMLERQREGIAIAKREGKYKGRNKKTLPDIAEVYQMYITRQKSKTELARERGISRPTLDKLLTEYERK